MTMSAVKGKVKIIDFWASWCGPCRLNNPALKEIYADFHDKGLEIIGVSLDEEKEDWEMAVEKDGLTWIRQLLDSQKEVDDVGEIVRNIKTDLTFDETFAIFSSEDSNLLA